MNEKRVLVIDSCLGCPKYRYEGEGDEWCDRVFQQMKGRPSGEVWPDCPLPRREPWLKLRDVLKTALVTLGELYNETIGPGRKDTALEMMIRAALEAVKEK